MNKPQENEKPGKEKTYSIIVNGRPRVIADHKLGYLKAIDLAFPGERPTDQIAFTVTYSNPHGKDGTLVAGGKEIPVKDGLILNVRKTDQS